MSLVFFLVSSAQAKPHKGFNEGPTLTLAGGLMQFDWDVNQRTGKQEGKKYEPTLALEFGWNVYDWLAPELLLRYTTNANGHRREHIAGIDVGLNFTWIAKPLVKFEKWKILPFLKPGFAFQIAALPGDVNSGKGHVIDKGFGPSISGGVRFTYKKYLYLGVEVQEEFLRQQNKYQVLNPGGNTLIYDGGFKRQLEIFTMVGVHY